MGMDSHSLVSRSLVLLALLALLVLLNNHSLVLLVLLVLLALLNNRSLVLLANQVRQDFQDPGHDPNSNCSPIYILVI